jgi:hypothetical protein
VAAHDLPHRGAAFDAAQEVVFFGRHRVSSIWRRILLAVRNLDI